MKKIIVYFLNKESKFTLCEESNNVEAILQSQYSGNIKGFNMVVLLGQQNLNEQIFILTHLQERFSSPVILKTYMEKNKLQSVKIHGTCKVGFEKRDFVTFEDGSHVYPYPHSSALLSLAGFLGLRAEFNDDQRLTYQEVSLSEL